MRHINGFGIPKMLQRVLPRRNLEHIISEASLDELIYMVAPYGCGKTMSVIGWLTKQNADAAWLNIGETGNPVLAISELKSNQSLILDKVLVLDNFHLIQDLDTLRQIKDLFLTLLGTWRIIIMGRNELPPLFNDFILKRRLRLITLSELSFTRDEVKNYFEINGVKLEPDELTGICQDTGGWPAAINTILAVPHSGAIKYNLSAKNYVMGFFEEEIWKQLSDKLKTFLLKTCILDTLTPSICHYVADMDDTHIILKNLNINGIFTSALGERDKYCYHRVFRDFLIYKLSDSGINANALHVKAGWWFYERNEPIPALVSFFNAKNIYGLNMTFKKLRPADLGMREYVETVSFLTSLNISELRECPEVAARIALLHFMAGNLSEMQKIYTVILDWFPPGVLNIRPEDYIDLYWETGWLRYVNPDEDILFDNEFREWLNIPDYAPHLIANDRSRASILRLPSALRSARDFSADAERFEKNYIANSGFKSITDPAAHYLFDLILAEIKYEQEDYNTAENIILNILPKIEEYKYTDLYFSATCLLVKIIRAVHNPDEICELSARVKAIIKTNGDTYILPNFNAFELRNKLSAGGKGLTKKFEEENSNINEPHYYLLYRKITYARALLSENKFSEAVIILGSLELFCNQYKRHLDLIEVKILRSVAEYNLGNEETSYSYIISALNEGQKNGYIRIFSDDAVLLSPILSLIRKSDENAFIKKVTISCKKTLSRAGVFKDAEQTAYEPLTKSELKILKLLAAGMSYEEMAVDNNIKVGTVRTHIHSIYSKLNVDNKVSAIVFAQNNGLIN